MIKFKYGKASFWITFSALILTILFFTYSEFLNQKHSKLEFIVLSKSKIYTINEDISGLSIIYNDEDLKQNNKNLTFFNLRITNSGNVAVLKEYFDSQSLYGIKILNGDIVNQPTIESMNPDNYFSNSIHSYSQDSIFFNELIYNQGDYYDVRFLVVHFEDEDPEITSFGKVANQSGINITNLENIEVDKKSQRDKILITFQSIAGSMVLFMLALNAYLYFTNRNKKRGEANEMSDEELLEFVKKGVEKYLNEEK